MQLCKRSACLDVALTVGSVLCVLMLLIRASWPLRRQKISSLTQFGGSNSTWRPSSSTEPRGCGTSVGCDGVGGAGLRPARLLAARERLPHDGQVRWAGVRGENPPRGAAKQRPAEH